MSENSVGTILLDLMIRNSITEQLDKIKSTAENPAKKLGESIESSVEAPINKTAENVQKMLGSAFEEASETAQKTTEKITESLDNGFNEAFARMLEREKKQQAEIEKFQDTKPRTVKLGNTMQYDVTAIEKEVNEYIGNAGSKIDEQLQKTFDRAKSFKIPTTPVERLEAELENTRAKSDLLKSEWKQLANSEPSEKVTAKMLHLQQQIIATDKATERLENDLKKANNLDSGILTGEYSSPEKPLDRLQRQFELTNQKIESVTRTWQQLQIDLQNTNDAQSAIKIRDRLAQTESQLISLSNTADRYKQKMNVIASETSSAIDIQFQSIFDRLKSFKIPTTPTERLQTELENTCTKTAMLQKKWQELSESEPSGRITEQMLRIQQQIVSAQGKAERLERKISDLGNSGHKLEIIKKVGRNAFNSLKKVGGKAIDSLNKRFSFIGKSATSLSKPIQKLGRTLKNTFRRVFVMATLYAAVKAIKKSFSDIMKSNDELSDSLNEVKANLSIAFTPVIQAVMPAINTMMSGLARATKYIAAFISGLFGMTYKQAADATKKLHDTGKKAEDTAKKATMSLAGIDEMNILSDNSGESENSENEDSGIDYSKLDMSEPELPDWAERLKNAIKTGDWYGVGEILAERVNAVFGGIDWENIEKKVTAGVSKICDLINGLIDNLNWEYLGNTISGGLNIITNAINTFSDNIHWETIGSGLAKGLNQAVGKIKWKQLGRSMSANIRILTDLLYSFVTEFDWKALGNGIGEAVNGWFDGIDFGKLGTTLSEGIKGIFGTLTATLQTVDFSGIGGKIAEFVNNIDVAGILSEFASSVSELVTGLLDFLISFIKGVDWISLGEQIFDGIAGMIKNIDWNGLIERVAELLGGVVGGASALIGGILLKAWDALKQAWDSVKDYFNKKIEECGENIFAGVLSGITDAVVGIGTWIKEHIFKPFINGFKKAFGIHSPSKEMVGMGGYIIDGLFNGISDSIEKIREIAEKVLDAIKDVFHNVGEWFSDKFRQAWDGVKSVWNGVRGFFSDIWNGIKNIFTSMPEWFSSHFESANDSICNIFGGIGDWFSERWNDITSALSEVADWFGNKFRQAWDNIIRIFEGIGGWFSDRWNDITNIFSAVGTWFGERFTNAWDGIKNAFNDVRNFFNDKWSDIKSVFSGISEWFGEKFSSAFDSIKNAFSGIGNFFYDIWEDVSGKAKDGMNWLLGRIEDGINTLVDGLNWFGFDLPDVMGGGHVGFDLNYVSLPRLANGGLATAPTLAMVGDNKNARTDPEVIAPLSKLEGMIGGNSEILELLKIIVELLKSGMNIEIINYMFRNSREFSREVLKVVADNKVRKGG